MAFAESVAKAVVSASGITVGIGVSRLSNVAWMAFRRIPSSKSKFLDTDYRGTPQELLSALREVVDLRRTVSEEVHVLRRPVRTAGPEREQHGALEDERSGISRLTQTKEEPFQPVPQENEVEIRALWPG